MRTWCSAVAVIATCLTASVAPARADIDEPGTALTADGYGVLLGSADAPVRLEIFCEPQCPDCAAFEATSGEQIARELGSGRLAVTYRWLTFLDAKKHNDTSTRVSNALFTAVDPATPATAYQEFVSDLYRHRDPHGEGPGAGELAGMAAESGAPGWVVARIAAGVPSVDTAAMNTANRNRLKRANPEHPGTPTVYDLNANTVVDIDEAGWLDRMMHAG